MLSWNGYFFLGLQMSRLEEHKSRKYIYLWPFLLDLLLCTLFRDWPYIFHWDSYPYLWENCPSRGQRILQFQLTFYWNRTITVVPSPVIPVFCIYHISEEPISLVSLPPGNLLHYTLIISHIESVTVSHASNIHSRLGIWYISNYITIDLCELNINIWYLSSANRHTQALKIW